MAILTLGTYKAFKNINSTTNDAVLSKIIPAVNSYITSYCNREFSDGATDITEYFDINTTVYYPKEFPLVSITTLKYSSESDGVYDEALTAYTDYMLNLNEDRIESPDTSSFAVTSIAVNSGEIIYKAGNGIPVDIEQAAVSLTENFLEESYTMRKALAGATIDNFVINDNTSKLPAHIRRVLEHHRRFIF